MFPLDEFLHQVERVRERTRRVAACIPADRVEWTYKPAAFTLGDRRNRALHLGRNGAQPAVGVYLARTRARRR